MNALRLFKQSLTREQKRSFDRLFTPQRIQAFLEALPYRDCDHYRSPLSVLNGAGACCLEGALVAAAVLLYHGHPARIIELVADDDDDHILTLYRRRGCWGSLAKSDFTGLRSREPVFRTLRELILSYFDGYYNEKARRTLRGYTVPLDLRRCLSIAWLTSDKAVDLISDALDKQRRTMIVTSAMARRFAPVDERSYKAGILGGREVVSFSFYTGRKNKRQLK
jgi:hypothetical protein